MQTWVKLKCLRWNGREVSKTKQINKPNTDDQAEKVLTHKVDTGQVDGEEDSIDRHELAITQSVK